MHTRNRSLRLKSISCCFSILTIIAIIFSSDPVLAGWHCLISFECTCYRTDENNEPVCLKYGNAGGRRECIKFERRACTAEESRNTLDFELNGHGVLPGTVLTPPPRE